MSRKVEERNTFTVRQPESDGPFIARFLVIFSRAADPPPQGQFIGIPHQERGAAPSAMPTSTVFDPAKCRPRLLQRLVRLESCSSFSSRDWAEPEVEPGHQAPVVQPLPATGKE